MLHKTRGCITDSGGGGRTGEWSPMGADILWCLGMVEWVLQHAHGKLVNSNSEVQLGDKCVVEYKVIGVSNTVET